MRSLVAKNDGFGENNRKISFDWGSVAAMLKLIHGGIGLLEKTYVHGYTDHPREPATI